MKRKVFSVIAICCLLFTMSACDSFANSEQTETTFSPSASSGIFQDTTEENTTSPAENDRYTLLRKNGTCYIRPQEQMSFSASDTGAMYYLQFPRFSSVKEMKERILSGELTDAEVFALMKKAGTEEAEIYNLDKLYEAVLPEGLTADYITLYGSGEGYAFSFEDIAGSVTCDNASMYDELFEQTYQNPTEYHYRKFLYEETLTDRNAVAYYTDLDGILFKQLVYALETNSGTTYVSELYRYEPVGNDETEEVISEVAIWKNVGGVKMLGLFYGLIERPSIEWLSSFNLREYVETEVS